jgi:hypothetical protein
MAGRPYKVAGRPWSAMSDMSDLDARLARLRDQPIDRDLAGLPANVVTRIEDVTPRPAVEVWGLRTAAIALVAAGGLMASAAATASPDPSPFAAWSKLAPSTLLGPGH